MYAEGNYYYIKAPKKDVYMMIDRDENILNFLEKCISEYGCLHSTNDSHSFEMCREHKGQRNRVYVTQLLMSYYRNRALNKSERIIHKDGNYLNCTRDNLMSCDDKLRLDRRSIIITTDDNYIYITHKPTGIKFVTTYEPELLRLIGSKRICWSLQNGKTSKGGKEYYRLKGEVFFRNKKCKLTSTSLSELVLGYYEFGVTINNLTTALRRMKKKLRSGGFVVEHLIADEMNNTKPNLSLSTEVTNAKKKVIDRKIQPPYYLIMAYKNGVYKAVYAFGDKGMLFVSPTIEEKSLEGLLDRLKGILNERIFMEYKSAIQWHKDSGLKKYNLPESFKIQSYMYDNFDNEYLDIMIGEYLQAYYGE